MSAKRVAKSTPYEIVNLYHGYIWRQMRQEETLAQLVTLWIANTAGKSIRKQLTLKDIFKDGRFKNPESFDEFMADFDGKEGDDE